MKKEGGSGGSKPYFWIWKVHSTSMRAGSFGIAPVRVPLRLTVCLRWGRSCGSYIEALHGFDEQGEISQSSAIS